MPCYEMRTVSVEFKAENLNLLKAAAESINRSFEKLQSKNAVMIGGMFIDLDEGEAEIRASQQNELNALKRAYSKQCIKAAAKKAQWSCKFAENKATINKVRW
jgi:hypothetical protein